MTRSFILSAWLWLAVLPLCSYGQAGTKAKAGTKPDAKAKTAKPSAKTAAGSTATPRVFVPSLPRTSYSRYPWKTEIVATVFWVGEQPGQNNPVPNDKSSWDPQWMENYGGFDDPDATKRTPNYTPAAFVPKENPFYIALPYNDVLNYNSTKTEAYTRIPWFKQRFSRPGRSVLKDQWIMIRFGNRVCYAQWEDCGPFVTDDIEYVFGNARPKNPENGNAGLDISPAVRDYLGLKSGAKVDWRFCDPNEVVDGPWRRIANSAAVVSARTAERQQIQNRLEELRRMRDEYFRQNGSGQIR
jgi:hypothetical protein